MSGEEESSAKHGESLAREMVLRISGGAERAGVFVSDREAIYSLSKVDPVTLEVRHTNDVFTKYGNPAFVTRITSRSAKFTEIFFGDPNERQARTMRAVADYLNDSKKELLYMDKQLGLHPEHSHYCRTIVSKDYARLLYMWDKLIFDLQDGDAAAGPEQVLVMIPEWSEVAADFNLPPISILVDAESRVTFVLGSDYFGEVKKAHLRMAMYAEKVRYKQSCNARSEAEKIEHQEGSSESGEGELEKKGGLGVHAGGKVIRAFDYNEGRLIDKGALFFGLSGTGKTTLSVHHFWLDAEKGETVIIRQDDFFLLSPDGRAFGTEDNAYIKTEGLEPEGQPLLYRGAISPHSVLENVYVDPKTLDVDFFRYDHPFVPGGKCYNGRGIVVRRELDFTDDSIDLERVDMIFFITRRETIVPPIVRLNREQAAAFFMLGESIITSAADPTKAGESVREVGTNPFIVGSKGEEGGIFYDILERNPSIQCFLINTGGFGGRNIERERMPLDAPGAVDTLRAYLAGERHSDTGKKVTVELRDGSTEELKISIVRFEVSYEGKRIKRSSEITELLERVERGEVRASDIELIEVAVLAGHKIRIQDSAAVIREIARSRIKWKKDPFWGYEVPAEIPGIDLSRFDCSRYYTAEEVEEMNMALKEERIAWLKSFEDLDERIVGAIG